MIMRHLILLQVLPEVLDEKEKELFTSILTSCYGNKDKVKGCDYRLSVILVKNQYQYSITIRTIYINFHCTFSIS